MPRYDYQCLSCGHKFELRQSFDSVPRADCPECEGVSKRKFYAVPIIYKGSGFYTTDYKNGGNSPRSKEEKEEGSKQEKEESSKGTNKASKVDSTTDSAKSEASKSDAPTKEKETAAKEA